MSADPKRRGVGIEVAHMRNQVVVVTGVEGRERS